MKEKVHLLSVTEVKSIFKDQTKEALLELLVESYKAVPELKEFITMKYANENTMEQILEKYKNKVYDVFFPKSMRAQFKIGEAKKAVNDFTKMCSDEKNTIDLMLYYVEMGVEFTNTYGDIGESFYSSIESMYEAVIKVVNKQKDAEIFHIFQERLKVVVYNTSGIGWGFHDNLSDMYSEIEWLELKEVDFDEDELKEIKEFILPRLEGRNDLPGLDKKMKLSEVISKVIDVDELFLSKTDAQGISYSNDNEYDFIARKTKYSTELIELILWQRCCYEMDKDYWTFEGKCKSCGSSELYIKEVPNEDFADQVICKKCGTEFIRK